MKHQPLYISAGQSSGVARALLRSEPRDTASQLAAARALRLGGTAGRVPANYFADAYRSAARNASSEAPDEPSRPSSRSFSR